MLVIAPKRVAENTWSKETAKWEHLQHLRVSRVMGTAKQRREALARFEELKKQRPGIEIVKDIDRRSWER